MDEPCTILISDMITRQEWNVKIVSADSPQWVMTCHVQSHWPVIKGKLVQLLETKNTQVAEHFIRQVHRY